MFKAHSDFPLHLAIQHQREDVVFLFLIEFNAQVSDSNKSIFIMHNVCILVSLTRIDKNSLSIKSYGAQSVPVYKYYI